jgi:hypothetical protein
MNSIRKAGIREAVKGGALAGLAGGVVLTLFMLTMSAASGRDPWSAIKGAGAPFLGARAMVPGWDATAVLLGVLGHLAVSVVWGVLFGLLFFGLSRAATIVAGIFWGLVVWIGMYYVLLPILGLERMVAEAPVGRSIAYHVIFGLLVAVAFLPSQVALPPRLRLLPGWRTRAGGTLP